MEQSARFSIPLLVPGQAQKELFHNEAIQLMEMLLCPAVDEAGLDAPPAAPELGACYIIGSGGTGDWAGHAQELACFTHGGWRFLSPTEGLQVVQKCSGQIMVYRGGVWENGILRCQRICVDGQPVVGPRQPAIADPGGGSIVDAECRAALASALAALRAHGLIG